MNINKIISRSGVLALLLTLLLGLTSMAAAQPGFFFDSGQSLSPGDDVAIGDLDGDGDLDAFVVSNRHSNKVWLNDGNGIFTDSNQNFGSSTSYGVELGDLDGDGDLDAFVANGVQADKVWLNDGSGTFTDSDQNLGSAYSYKVDLGDIDGDGDLDAVVANLSSLEPEEVWENDGLGNFTLHQSISFSSKWQTRDIQLGDIDGDTDLDAVFAEYDYMQIWKNDGSGTFSFHQRFRLTNHQASVALGDLDGDNDLDAVIGSEDGRPESVWLNDGSGTFSIKEQSPGQNFFDAGNSTFDVALGDVDGDGDLDGFFPDMNEYGQIQVWFNDGSGVFSRSGQNYYLNFNWSVKLGDLDGDGDLDAFAGNTKVLLNQSPPSNQPPVAVCQDVTLALDENGQATLTASDVDDGSYDPDDDDITLSIDKTDFTCADIGDNTVTLTVSDGQETDQCQSTVTVVDNTPPVPDVTNLPDVVGECSATISSAPTATDNCAGVVSGTTTDPLTYNEQGTYTVTWTYDDGNGNSVTQEQQVIVDDVTKPVLTVITDRITLWPPNHKYETISLSDLVVSVSDNCANLTMEDVVITKATSDEEEDAKGGGDGNTKDDIAFPNGCSSVDLRAERQGSGNGRVYTIHLAVADGNGNTGTATCLVQVPHDKKDTAVDDGPVYEVASGSLPKRIGDNQFVSDQQTLPEGYALLPAYPNPFNPTTEISYVLPKNSEVGLMIFNLSGQLVRILDAGQRSAGIHTVQWDATDDDGNRVASGVYLVVLKAGNFVAQQRMVFMK